MLTRWSSTKLTQASIYALCDPRTDEVRYVGKANNPKSRLRSHLKPRDRTLTHKDCWVASLAVLGLKPKMVILETVDADTWKAAECKWILHYRRLGANLTNHSDGGDGYNPNEATRAKMRANGIAWWDSLTEQQRIDHVRNPERCRKISEANTGKPQPWAGRIQFAEEKEKRSAKLRGRPRTIEVKEKLRKAASNMTPEHKAKISAAKVKWWAERKGSTT